MSDQMGTYATPYPGDPLADEIALHLDRLELLVHDVLRRGDENEIAWLRTLLRRVQTSVRPDELDGADSAGNPADV